MCSAHSKALFTNVRDSDPQKLSVLMGEVPGGLLENDH